MSHRPKLIRLMILAAVAMLGLVACQPNVGGASATAGTHSMGSSSSPGASASSSSGY